MVQIYCKERKAKLVLFQKDSKLYGFAWFCFPNLTFGALAPLYLTEFVLYSKFAYEYNFPYEVVKMSFAFLWLEESSETKSYSLSDTIITNNFTNILSLIIYTPRIHYNNICFPNFNVVIFLLFAIT